MKAGLTVLLAVASASVNTHVKVETVNFDEDLLNTEKNIAETSAWKEKKDKTDGPQPDETDETKTDETDETKPQEPGIYVTFNADKCTKVEYGVKIRCDGELNMKSHGIAGLNSLESVAVQLEGEEDRWGCNIKIGGITWLAGHLSSTKPEGRVVENILEQMQKIAKQETDVVRITWKISKTILSEGDVMKSTQEIIDSLNKK